MFKRWNVFVLENAFSNTFVWSDVTDSCHPDEKVKPLISGSRTQYESAFDLKIKGVALGQELSQHVGKPSKDSTECLWSNSSVFLGLLRSRWWERPHVSSLVYSELRTDGRNSLVNPGNAWFRNTKMILHLWLLNNWEKLCRIFC